ncbi:hypothetical protein [Lactococcus petauri]|uniref:hypothetical protein n=1 Tax=Lactococcus petauri TaxID=1940789 RepID=UPI0018A89F5D|nr:hypothetical protein [Lactococcus petauri]MDC0826073.1 hypothetical protein [Lactococcus petauri]
MNPEISELFELIAEHDNDLFCYLDPCPFMKRAIDRIKEISATLNPQIPEPYASMSRAEILGGIGQYEI